MPQRNAENEVICCLSYLLDILLEYEQLKISLQNEIQGIHLNLFCFYRTLFIINIFYLLAQTENLINRIEKHFEFVRDEISVRIASYRCSLDEIEESYSTKLSKGEDLEE